MGRIAHAIEGDGGDPRVRAVSADRDRVPESQGPFDAETQRHEPGQLSEGSDRADRYAVRPRTLRDDAGAGKAAGKLPARTGREHREVLLRRRSSQRRTTRHHGDRQDREEPAGASNEPGHVHQLHQRRRSRRMDEGLRGGGPVLLRIGRLRRRISRSSVGSRRSVAIHSWVLVDLPIGGGHESRRFRRHGRERALYKEHPRQLAGHQTQRRVLPILFRCLREKSEESQSKYRR
mmetsp:Transcript_23161/g.54763  ORF Transcript_23161/g.54763 Transcript_23161/m.54763 type:complete len:234 (+) Transcript_23161:637-1338(+)